jgi:NADH-quinone oxidoreductase subunit B
MTYECGEQPIGHGQIQFHVQFYLYAIIFVIFDIVTVFLMIWPWLSARRRGQGLHDCLPWFALDRRRLRLEEGGSPLDLRLAPNAIAMSSKEFIGWSTDVMAQLMRATGMKKAVDKISAPIWSWALRNANYPLHFGIACCAQMAAASVPRFDAERLGMIYGLASADGRSSSTDGHRQASAGPEAAYEQMAEPRWVVAMGECAISGGPWYDSYNTVQGVDTFIPVDVYIPGCPPRPEAMIDGFMKLHKKIHKEMKGTFLED